MWVILLKEMITYLKSTEFEEKYKVITKSNDLEVATFCLHLWMLNQRLHKIEEVNGLSNKMSFGISKLRLNGLYFPN